MSKYGRVVNGKTFDVFELPPSVNASDAAAVSHFLAVQWGGVATANEFRQMPDYAVSGLEVDQQGNVAEPTEPLPPIIRPGSISRRRFDDIFATAIGEVEYDDILDLLAAIAATDPKTEQSVQVKRALRALDAAGDIDFPIGEWKDATDANDLTGKFLLVVIAVCTPTIPDIATKIDAGLTAWASTAA